MVTFNTSLEASPPFLPIHNTSMLEELRRDAMVQERERIAHAIHDGPAQQFAHALHKLEYIQRLFLQQQLEQIDTEIEQVHSILEHGLDDLRRTIAENFSEQNVSQPFLATFRALISDYQHTHPELDITYEVIDIDEYSYLSSQVTKTIFSLLQEALTNIWKHAQATHIHIDLHQDVSLLIIEVSDNGVGFHADLRLVATAGEEGHHIGLHMMRERVQQVGGSWELTSRPGMGTRIKASFPLAQSVAELSQREREVLSLVAAGLSNRAIALHLSISNNTVKSHIRHIIQKLRVKDRAQAVAIAAHHGWLSRDKP